MRTFINHTSCACKYKEDIVNSRTRSQADSFAPPPTTTRRPSKRSQRDGVTRMQNRLFDRPTTTMTPFSHFQRDAVTRVYGNTFEGSSSTVAPFRQSRRDGPTRPHDGIQCPGGFVRNNGHAFRCKWHCLTKYDESTCENRRNGSEQFYIQERK